MNIPEKSTQIMQRFDTIYALRTPIFVDRQLCGVMINFTGLASDKPESSLKVHYIALKSEVILITNNNHIVNNLCNQVSKTRNYKTGSLQNHTFFFSTDDLPLQNKDECYLYLAYLADLETTIVARDADTLERWIHKIKRLMYKPRVLDQNCRYSESTNTQTQKINKRKQK